MYNTRESILGMQIAKVERQLLKSCENPTLSTFEACRELLIGGGELGQILWSDKLKSLKAVDVATYIVLHT